MPRLAAALALLIALLIPSRARADVPNFGPVLAIGGALLAAVAAVDTVVTVHDFNVAGHDERPTNGWNSAELVLAAPQAGIIDWAASKELGDEDGPEQVALTIPGIWTTTMLTHSILSFSLARADPKLLPGLSTAIGTDATFTSIDLIAAARGKWPTRAYGVTEALLAAPPAAASIYAGATSDSQRGEWVALGAWSGALVLHGVATAIVGPHGKPDPPETAGARSRRAHSFGASPGVIGDGKARGPGVVAWGRF